MSNTTKPQANTLDMIMDWHKTAHMKYQGTKIGVLAEYRQTYMEDLFTEAKKSAKQQLLAEVLDMIAKTTRTTVLGEKWLFEQELIDKAKERFS